MPHPTSRHKASTGELVQAGDPANNAVRVNIVAGAGSGGTAATDDAAFTVGGTSYTPVGGTYRSVLDSVDDGDGGVFAMTQTRAIFANIRDDAGDSAMDGANNALRVNIVAGAGSGGTAMTDDAAFTPAGTSITPMGAFCDETGTDSVDEGDGGVVRMSADRILYSQTPDRTVSGTLGALNATVTIPLNGKTGVGFNIDTTTLSATLVVEFSGDGTNFNLFGTFVEASGWNYHSTWVFTAATVRESRSVFVASAATHVRIRVSAYTSGTATGTLVAGSFPGPQLVQQVFQGDGTFDGWWMQGDRASGTASTTNPVKVAGHDGTNVRNLKNDTSGRLEVKVHDGTNFATIRDLASNDALNVAIVDGSGAQITSFGGGTQYTEDVAAAADPIGNASILIRQDTPATLTTTDGDNVAQRGTNYGAAYTQIVTSAGAFVDTFGGGTQYTEGDVDATITGTAAMMEVAGNTLQPVQGTVADGLLVNLGTNNDVTVSGTVTANAGTGFPPVVTDGAAAGTTGIHVLGTDGTNAQILSTNTTGHVNIADGGNVITVDGTVNIGTFPDNEPFNVAQINGVTPLMGNGVTGTGSQRVTIASDNTAFTVNVGTFPDNEPFNLNQVGGSAILTGGTAGSQGVGGLAAHAAAASGNPVYVGGRASTALPTDVGADGDVAAFWTNRNGATVVAVAPHVGLNSDPYNLLHETAQYTTTQTSTVLVAGGASEKVVVTKVQIQVGGTTAGTLQLYYGTGAYSRGTSRAIFDGEFAPSATLKPGVVMDGPWISGTNGDDLLVTTSAAINPLTITVWYYVVV